MNQFSEHKFIQYLDDLYAKTSDERLQNLAAKQSILNCIKSAAKIVELRFSDFLQKIDFKINDRSVEALESLLAEARAVFWLKDFKFKDIIPIASDNKSPQPDFTAKYNNKVCSIEVFCLTRTHEQKKDQKLNVYKNFDAEFEGSKFGRDYFTKAADKKEQLDKMQANVKVLLCVINSSPVVNLNSRDEMQKHAQFLYEALQWGHDYYVGLLTGGDGDVIYPEIS